MRLKPFIGHCFLWVRIHQISAQLKARASKVELSYVMVVAHDDLGRSVEAQIKAVMNGC